MYAQLKQREIKNKGISQDQIDVEGVYPIEKKYKLTWSEQLDKWQLVLENLSKEIEVGQTLIKVVKQSVILREAEGICHHRTNRRRGVEWVLQVVGH